MRKISLLALVVLCGCGLFDKKSTLIIHDLNVDFPVTDTIAVNTLLQTLYPEYGMGYNFLIQDSAIFMQEQNQIDFGTCYALGNGNVISRLINKGKASNEMGNINNFSFYHKDSIQFVDYMEGIIKIFSIKDILLKPAGERECSVSRLPAGVYSVDFIKHNGKMLGVGVMTEKLYFLYDGNEVHYFGEYDIDLVKFKNVKRSERNMKSTSLFFNANIVCHEDKAIIANELGLSLNIIDINAKSVTHERYYSKYLVDGGSFSSIIDYKTNSVKCDDKNVYCIVQAYNPTSRTPENMFDNYILVYDWQLNPVKRYYLEDGDCIYSLSEDCKTVYRSVTTDEKKEIYETKL